MGQASTICQKKADPPQQPPVRIKEPSQAEQQLYLQSYNINFPHEYAILHSMRPLQIGDAGLIYICRQPWDIRYLNLDNQKITAKGIEALVKARWVQMTELSLLQNKIGDEGIQLISKAGWKQIKGIILNDNGVSEKGIKLLVSADWPKLAKLQLSGNCLGMNGIRHLSMAKWANLQELRLGMLRLSRTRQIQVNRDANISQKQTLNSSLIYSSHNHIGNAGASHICRGIWPHLKILDISSNNLTEGIARMLTTANWPQLKILLTVHNSLTEEGIRSLSLSFWSNMATLRVENNKISSKWTEQRLISCLQIKFGITTRIKY